MPTETVQPSVNGAALSPLDVLTLAQAAAYLQLPEDAVRAEAEAGRLPGRLVGGDWRFVRDAVADWLRTGKPDVRSARERMDALIGMWKDDPTADAVIEHIERRRKQDNARK